MKKNISLILFILLLCNITIANNLRAQTQNTDTAPLEQDAKFAENEEELKKFISKNLKLPKGIKEAETLVCTLNIDVDGAATFLGAMAGERENDEKFIQQVTNMVSKMPKWIPATYYDGEVVGTEIFLGINYDSKTVIAIAHSHKAYDREPNIADLIKQDEDGNSYLAIDQMASFPGGDSEMMEYMYKNFRYPEEAEKNKIEGRVIVRFVVEKDGSLSDIKLARGIDADCDAEALRIVKAMPNWEPAMHDGKPMRFDMTLPILFRLNPNSGSK